jgi:hypothetical protein
MQQRPPEVSCGGGAGKPQRAGPSSKPRWRPLWKGRFARSHVLAVFWFGDFWWLEFDGNHTGDLSQAIKPPAEY